MNYFQGLARHFRERNKRPRVNFLVKTLFSLVIFVPFFFLAQSSVSAATYYVDPDITDVYVGSATPDFTTYNHLTFATDTGSDSVYKTIADINATSFAAGDSVLFKQGGTWTGTRLMPASSGSVGQYITFDSFGTGAAPSITAGSGGAFFANAKNYIIVQNLTFIGGAEPFKFAGHDNKIINCTVSGGTTSANPNIGAYGPAATVYNISIIGCTVYGGAGHGIYVAGESAGAITGVTIQGNTVYSNGTSATLDHGIYLKYGSNSVIQDNVSYSNTATGILINYLAAGADVTVRRNKSYSNGFNGIELAGTIADGSLLKVYNNLVYNNFQGIRMAPNVSGVSIYNNTFFNNGTGASSATLVMETGGQVNNIIKNNIFYGDYNLLGDGKEPIRVATAAEISANTWDYNNILFANHAGETGVSFRVVSPLNKYTLAQWQALTGSPDAHSISVDSSFVSTSTPDFHLLRTSSNIDAGTNVSLTSDYAGTTVPQGSAPDIGAYEFIYLTSTLGSSPSSGPQYSGTAPLPLTVVERNNIISLVNSGVFKYDAYLSVGETLKIGSFRIPNTNYWQTGSMYEVWWKSYFNNAKILSPEVVKPFTLIFKYDPSALEKSLSEKRLRLAYSTNAKTWKIIPSILDTKKKQLVIITKQGGYYMLVSGYPQTIQSVQGVETEAEITIPTPTQTLIQQPTIPVQTQPVPKAKTCILWWCF